MARFRYFDHADPSGRSPFQRMADCGFKSRLALGREHRRRPAVAASRRPGLARTRPAIAATSSAAAFRYIGVGAVHRSGSVYGWYWTQDFGR